MSQATFNPSGLPHAAATLAAERARAATLGERSAATRQIVGAASNTVEQAIANAARSTSVEFDYLVAQAQVESAMNPQAQAPTSSASGLYQFIESTWLNTMKRHGERFGLGDVADQIRVTRSGGAYVADPAQRAAILDLRNDPGIASLMAAGLAEDNRAHLMPILGRQPEAGELYLAHFLGAGGAGRFLSAMQTDPQQSAASLFRRPAAANRAVFFEPGGQPRSLAGVMNVLTAKIERAMPDANAPASFAARVNGFAPRYPTAREVGVPYLITAEEVLTPRGSVSAPSAQARAPRIEPSPTLSMPGAPLRAAPAPPTRSMSGLLGETFKASGASELASSQGADSIRRAYQRLRALGL